MPKNEAAACTEYGDDRRADQHFFCPAESAHDAAPGREQRHHHDQPEEKEAEEKPPGEEEQRHQVAISAVRGKRHSDGGEKRGECTQRQPARVAREVNVAQPFLHLDIDLKEIAIQRPAVFRIEDNCGAILEEFVKQAQLFWGQGWLQTLRIDGLELRDRVFSVLGIDLDAATSCELRNRGRERAAVASRGADVAHRRRRKALRRLILNGDGAALRLAPKREPHDDVVEEQQRGRDQQASVMRQGSQCWRRQESFRPSE